MTTECFSVGQQKDLYRWRLDYLRPFWLKSVVRQTWGKSFLLKFSMKWGQFLALVACNVSCAGSGGDFGHGHQGEATLPPGGCAVGGIHSASWRPRGGPAVAGGNATTSYRGGLRGSGSVAEQRANDGNAGHACGAGIPFGEKDLLGEQRNGLGNLGGSKSLGDTQAECGEGTGGGTRGVLKRKEAETQQRPRPDGRLGVLGGTRGDEAEMAKTLQGSDGWLSFGRGGTDAGAGVGVEEEGGRWFGAFRRLLGLRTVREEGNESGQVPELSAGPFNRRIYGEGAARPKCLWDVATVLQSLQGGFGHVGLGGLHDPQQVREPHGKTGKDIRWSVAPVGNRGRESKRRASSPGQVEGGDRPERREVATTGLGRCKTVEPGVSVGAGGREVLEGTSPHAGFGLVGNGGQRIASHPRGEVHARNSLGGQGLECTSWHGPVRGGQPEKEIKQREKGCSQEEVQIRKGGARKMEKQRWRKRKRQRRWEERKRKERRKVLLLELWIRSVQGTSNRRKVQRTGDSGSQLSEVWVTGTSSSGVPGEQLNWWSGMLVWWLWKKSKEETPVWEEEPVEGKKKKKKKKKGTGAGGWRDGPGLKNRDRDKVPSEDEGDKKERKKRDREGGGDEDHNSQEDYADEPYLGHLKMAQAGLVDGYHAGFPCTTFSRLKFREAENYPGPLRTATFPYGRPENSARQQEQCDKGTVLAARAAKMATTVLNAPRETTVKPCSTLENPPPSDVEDHLSAWELAEVAEFLKRDRVNIVQFCTCAYQQDLAPEERFYKPQMLAGALLGHLSLDKTCRCGILPKQHKAVVGKELSEKSAEYPKLFCQRYAALLMENFQKMGRQEFLQKKMNALHKTVEEAKKAEEKKESKPTAEEPKDQDKGSKTTKKRKREKAEDQRGPRLWTGLWRRW